jgi:hypothetical protein
MNYPTVKVTTIITGIIAGAILLALRISKTPAPQPVRRPVRARLKTDEAAIDTHRIIAELSDQLVTTNSKSASGSNQAYLQAADWAQNTFKA